MKEKILILVKTYPTFSRKYFELVCTAGINEKGEWRRIYPVPFRQLRDWEKYRKYQWVEADIEKNPSDSRPESYKLRQGLEIKILGKPLSTQNSWHLRKDVLKDTPVYTHLDEIIEKAKEHNIISLCQFKPKEILKLKVEETEREWNSDILNQIKAENDQKYLFDYMKNEIRLVRKLPYKFSYRFKDKTQKESTMMIEDWEIGKLYWNCLKYAGGDESAACRKVKEKYEHFIENNDITLFLGTIHKFHRTARNPFVIIGVFYPPKTKQLELF